MRWRNKRMAEFLAGGVFTFIGGQTRNHIARLNPTTGLADSFNPNADDYVGSILEQADGKVLVGGAFTLMGGTTRTRIARLNSTGSDWTLTGLDLPLEQNFLIRARGYREHRGIGAECVCASIAHHRHHARWQWCSHHL
jgi:hypothetical protein